MNDAYFLLTCGAELILLLALLVAVRPDGSSLPEDRRKWL